MGVKIGARWCEDGQGEEKDREDSVRDRYRDRLG